MNVTYLTAAPVRSHASFCAERGAHDGQCTSAGFSVPLAGVDIDVWIVGDKGGAPEVAVDGLQALDGRRLSLTDVNTLTEALIVLGFAMDRAIDEAVR